MSIIRDCVLVWRQDACGGKNSNMHITKTCLYNFDPLKPHFYIIKLGFTGVYIIFLFLLKNIDCGYPLEPPRVTHNLCFEQKYEKCQNFLSENFRFLAVNFSVYLNRRVFVMILFLSTFKVKDVATFFAPIRLTQKYEIYTFDPSL